MGSLLGRTPRSELISDWLPMDADERRYLNIELNNVKVTSEDLPFHGRLAFWDRIIGPIGGDRGDANVKDEL